MHFNKSFLARSLNVKKLITFLSMCTIVAVVFLRDRHNNKFQRGHVRGEKESLPKESKSNCAERKWKATGRP
ncbi:hypothetical protein RvY_19280-2 [Ramazzottius varieornatus]|uniref:Uncharacterized protein n=1 Tax=Ramazzottius varieornatus TaxID=947166 RepID=A0A1D1W8X2_RAMVA|nr:hypothetical protein RvY_19280-2 [Ramazzottius varieornatus]